MYEEGTDEDDMIDRREWQLLTKKEQKRPYMIDDIC